MSNCCIYFIVEVLRGNIWISTGFSSKSMKEINSYISQNNLTNTRIVQRSVESDRAKGLRTPKCC